MVPVATSLSISPIGSLVRNPPSILAMPIVRKTQATYKRSSNQIGAACRAVKGQRTIASVRPRMVDVLAERNVVVVCRGVVIIAVSLYRFAICVILDESYYTTQVLSQEGRFRTVSRTRTRTKTTTTVQ